MVQNSSRLYRIEAETGRDEPHSGVLLVTLGAFIDAGKIQRLLGDHLAGTCDAEVLASFDIDRLYDYRGRRPVMVFDSNRWASYETPSLQLRRLVDRDGDHYFLLSGPEPDFQWERLVEEVRDLIVELGISLVVTVHGVPMSVPHTRPVGMTAHATDVASSETPSRPSGASRCPPRSAPFWSSVWGRQATRRQVSPSMCRITWPRRSLPRGRSRHSMPWWT